MFNVNVPMEDAMGGVEPTVWPLFTHRDKSEGGGSVSTPAKDGKLTLDSLSRHELLVVAKRTKEMTNHAEALVVISLAQSDAHKTCRIKCDSVQAVRTYPISNFTAQHFTAQHIHRLKFPQEQEVVCTHERAAPRRGAGNVRARRPRPQIGQSRCTCGRREQQ